LKQAMTLSCLKNTVTVPISENNDGIKKFPHSFLLLYYPNLIPIISGNNFF
jgi:hypothetical protein